MNFKNHFQFVALMLKAFFLYFVLSLPISASPSFMHLAPKSHEPSEGLSEEDYYMLRERWELVKKNYPMVNIYTGKDKFIFSKTFSREPISIIFVSHPIDLKFLDFVQHRSKDSENLAIIIDKPTEGVDRLHLKKQLSKIVNNESIRKRANVSFFFGLKTEPHNITETWNLDLLKQIFKQHFSNELHLKKVNYFLSLEQLYTLFQIKKINQIYKDAKEARVSPAGAFRSILYTVHSRLGFLPEREDFKYKIMIHNEKDLQRYQDFKAFLKSIDKLINNELNTPGYEEAFDSLKLVGPEQIIKYPHITPSKGVPSSA